MITAQEAPPLLIVNRLRFNRVECDLSFVMFFICTYDQMSTAVTYAIWLRQNGSTGTDRNLGQISPH